MTYDTQSKEQQKAIDAVGNDLTRAAAAAHEKLVAAGFDPDSTRCRLCDCEGYRFGGFACKTPGCGHSIMRHEGTT